MIGYGWPQVCKQLLADGLRTGMERVRKLMQLHAIKARDKRKYKASTGSKHNLPVADDLLQRNFSSARMEQRHHLHSHR